MLCEMLPLELGEVSDGPGEVSVKVALRSPNGSPIQADSDPLGQPLIQKLDPTINEAHLLRASPLCTRFPPSFIFPTLFSFLFERLWGPVAGTYLLE
jgi:hypothetical protein